MRSNVIIDVMMNHVSVRSFTDQKLEPDQVSTLLRAAQAAASSNFLQAYTIIDITEPQLLAKIAELAGDQPFVATGSNFFVFCADMARDLAAATSAAQSSSDVARMTSTAEGADILLVASIDAALAAQNLMLAAESMGLGGCYIGGLRENIDEISELLNLPERVYPVFGVVIGYPAERNAPKPRLPLAAVSSQNRYNPDTSALLEHYNEQMQRYYASRPGGGAHRTWIQGIVHTLLTHPRDYMLAFLNKHKWILH